MDVYELARGPLAWATLIVFLSGVTYRIAIFSRARKSHKSIYPTRSLGNGIRALFHGLIPFASTYMRSRPVFTIVTGIFHICLLLLPLFLLAHIILWYESWELLWWSLPDRLADAMAILVILACLFFLIRRFSIREVKHVTRPSDILLLVLVLTPFLTGFLAAHHFGPYRPLLIFHILSSEMLILAIPFSKLSHMILFFFTRVHMGAEFGSFMKASDW
jgi:nitrate reductase gamma subunit